jgi:hypothetical protein
MYLRISIKKREGPRREVNTSAEDALKSLRTTAIRLQKGCAAQGYLIPYILLMDKSEASQQPVAATDV